MTIMAHPLLTENIWFDKFRYEDAEKIQEERKAQAHSGLVVEGNKEPVSNAAPESAEVVAAQSRGAPTPTPSPPQVEAPTPPPTPEQGSSTLVSEIARAREHIQKSLSSAGQGLAVGVGVDNTEIFTRLQSLESENQGLRKVTADLQAVVAKLENRIAALELDNKSAPDSGAASVTNNVAPAPEDSTKEEEEKEEEFDLWSDDDETPVAQSPKKEGTKTEKKEESSSEEEDFGPLWDADDTDNKATPVSKSPKKEETMTEKKEESSGEEEDFGPLWDTDDTDNKAAAAAAPADEEEDDDEDLFGSDSEEDEEAERIKAERVKAYQERKSKKPALIAKSNIILDVKPWDDETDMAEMEKNVRSLATAGLLWGGSKLVAVGYGIKKLQIGCVVEDDKVSVDWLEEKITEFEDFVQSVDIAAFNKV